jgi:hypothetical protein
MHPVILERVSFDAETRTDSRLAARLAASASFGAAVIHFSVAPTHWQEWMPSGVFFVSLALAQLIWAPMVLTRMTTGVLAGGIALNIGAIALWALSRTAGAPFGPHAGQPEFVQAADLCALLLQIYVVIGAGWVTYRGHHGEPIPALANAMVFLCFGGVVALASAAGVISGMGHGHHGPAGAEPDHHAPSIGHADHHGSHAEPVTAPPTIEPNVAPAPAVTPPAAVPLHDHGAHHHDE